MSSRIVKQLIYGLMYWAVFVSVIFGGYFIWKQSTVSCFDNLKNQNETEVDCGGSCVICAIKNLTELKVLPIKFFNAEGLTTAFIQIQNINQDYAARSFNFQLNLYDIKGEKIFNYDGIKFVYAADTASFVLPALEVSFSQIARSELLVNSVEWELKDSFSKPDVEIKNISIKLEKERLVIDSDFTNSNLYTLGDVIISALLVSDSGFFVNASKTSLGSMSPLALKHFKVFIPVSMNDKFSVSNIRLFVEARK